MALPPLLKRRKPDIADTRPAEQPDPQGRSRARRRLIGAAVLVGLGVITFPLLFESQPRPVPTESSKSLPARDSTASTNVRGRQERVASGTIGDAAAAAQAPVASSDVAAAAPASAPAPAVLPAVVPALPKSAEQPKAPVAEPAKAPEKSVARVPDKPAARPAEKAPPKAAEKAPERATDKLPPPAKPTNPPPAANAESRAVRYVVQVGAYADDASAKEARSRVERLGLKTFTQDVEVQGARRVRVRVGPFETQAEADRAVATLKAGKLPGVVLKL